MWQGIERGLQPPSSKDTKPSVQQPFEELRPADGHARLGADPPPAECSDETPAWLTAQVQLMRGAEQSSQPCRAQTVPHRNQDERRVLFCGYTVTGD